MATKINTRRRKKKREKWKRFRLAIRDTFREYAMRTKVSGIWLLRPTRTHGVTRVLWSLVLFCLFILGVYLSLQLWIKFYSYPILNTISNDLPINDIPFPGITVCSPKVVNWERARRFVKTLHIPPQFDFQQVLQGLDYINSFTEPTWTPAASRNSFVATEEVLRINQITIKDAAAKLSADCSDFVQRCFWRNKEFPCKQKHPFLSFVPTTSHLGPCCSFNYHPQKTDFTPFASNTFGLDGGLTFVGVEGSEHDVATGLLVLVHHPMDYVSEAASSMTITANSESFIEILPTVQSSSVEVLELSPEKRDCLTSSDVTVKSYRQAACVLACERQIISDYCHCSPYHFPKFNPDYRECRLNDTTCYSKNVEKFKSVRCDQCLPNCHDVTYATVAYKTDLLLHNFSFNHFHNKKWNYTPESILVHIFLSKQVVPAIHKVTTMSWVGLLSDLGGVFNLCLGLSMISVVEFLYFCTYRLRVHYKRRCILMQN